MSESRLGFFQGLAAYLMWGCFPLFFKLLSPVPVKEVLAHRIVWAAVILLVLVKLTGAGRALSAVFHDPAKTGALLITAALLATNWSIFITAVFKGYVLESSLGYYINPLVSILLGALVFRERLSARQKVSIFFAALGVLVQTLMLGKVPLVSLALAFTFGLYGLVRKRAAIQAVVGLTVEMCLIAPVALGYLVWVMAQGKASFGSGGISQDLLLVLAGVLTATPLTLYGGALNRLRLSTIGIMQYIVPTGHFLCAVFVFGEPFTSAHLVSFALIWTALAIYTSGSLGELRPVTQAAGQTGS